MSFYDSDLTTIAFVWRLERRDGVTLGFTSHDLDLIRDGLTYRAAPGMLPSAIERNDTLTAANVSLAGALTSDAIRADDLASGRWDGAWLWVSVVDWADPAAGPLPLVRGELGTVDIADNSFKAELRGATVIFEAPVAEQTSPDCRARLGDKRCRINMAGRRITGTVISASGATITIDQAANVRDYAFGKLRWLDGRNAGLSARIADNSGAAITLQEPPDFEVSAGTRVEITEGCDKRFATCTSRFSNAVNFRGEPHLPGNDLLSRYGG
jgi:uncharacterized phage protein (TIGR02218 family)